MQQRFLFLGPQCGPQFRAKSRALNALLGRFFEFFAIYMTAMKRCRECWVDWQRFQNNESDMFKNNNTRQTHGAAFKIQSLNVCKSLKEALYFGATITQRRIKPQLEKTLLSASQDLQKEFVACLQHDKEPTTMTEHLEGTANGATLRSQKKVRF